jgi:membrane-bound metal-dependent hydrolase YbcI (DUF457 family)
MEREEKKSFAVGHFASGYIFCRLTAQATKTKLNIPLVIALSVIPDIDILIPFLEHRGPTHSIIVAIIVFIPILFIWRKNAFPYLIALIQHSLVGDFIAGGKTQLLWPLTSQLYGLEINIKDSVNISLEWVFFLASAIIMLKTKDVQTLLQPHNSNLILLLPTFTVLLPTFLAFPLDVPLTLILPHIIFLTIFSASLLTDFKQILSNTLKEKSKSKA